MNLPKNAIGVGKALMNNTKMFYNGTLPDDTKQNEALVCMRKADLELLLSTAQYQLTLTKIEMKEDFYEQRPGIGAIFPDELHWRTEKPNPDNPLGVTKLYLDRHWYTFDPRETIWIRYESIEEAENEGEI